MKIVSIEAREVVILVECPACDGLGWQEVVKPPRHCAQLEQEHGREPCGVCVGGELELAFSRDECGWGMMHHFASGLGGTLEEVLRDAFTVDRGMALVTPQEVEAIVEAWASRYGVWRISRDDLRHPLVAVHRSGTRFHICHEPRGPNGMLAILAALAAPEVAEWFDGQRPRHWLDVADDQLPVPRGGDVVAAWMMDEEVEK